MYLGGLARLADIDIAVINAAVVDQLRRGIEDSGFGGYGCVSAPDEHMMRIAQWLAGEVILGDVILDGRYRFGGIRIDEPKAHAALAEFPAEPLQLGRVAIRDRAIGADEEKDLDAGVRTKWIDRLAAEIDCFARLRWYRTKG